MKSHSAGPPCLKGLSFLVILFDSKKKKCVRVGKLKQDSRIGAQKHPGAKEGDKSNSVVPFVCLNQCNHREYLVSCIETDPLL
jgi:hypothetical protein